jgi:hypothetical protein
VRSQSTYEQCAAGISPSDAETLPESELEQRVFGPSSPVKPPKLVPPDFSWVHTEFKRHRYVTLQLLWEEYVERHGELPAGAAPFAGVTGAGSSA